MTDPEHTTSGSNEEDYIIIIFFEKVNISRIQNLKGAQLVEHLNSAGMLIGVLI